MTMDHNNVSKTPTAKSTAELQINAIVTEVERLQSDHVTCDSLLLNHSTCDSVYLNEMLVKLGPEFPTVELDAGSVIKAPSDCDNRLPETNLDKGADEEIILSSDDECGIEERSTVSGVEVETRLNRLQQQQEMILKNNSDLKSQVIQQREMILDLQQNNLDLNRQMKKQQELILALQHQLNTITEIYRLNFQALKDERLKSQNTQTHQELTTAELTDRVQIGIAEIDDAVVVTNERSLLTDPCQMEQLQDVERVQSSAEDVERMEDDADQDITSEVVEPEQAIPSTSHYEDNLNQIERSLRTKRVRAVRIRSGKDGGKRTLFNLETIEESPKEAGVRHSRKKSKMYSCAECEKQFKWKSDLIKHFRIHTGEKPYNCEDCGAAFSQLGSLRTHQRIHSGEKPYNCEDCGAAFSQLGSLRTHQRIHSGEKPYNCEDCGAAFSRSDSLRSHQRIHSGEKPYNCEECGAAFNRLGNLRTHQLIHSDERPFICDFCKKSFKRKDDLSKHMAIHIDKRSHQCNVCDKEFRFKSNLVRHLQLH